MDDLLTRDEMCFRDWWPFQVGCETDANIQ